MNLETNRCRGIVLTPQGLRRLKNAIVIAQEQEKFGLRFTQAELSERVKLSIKTIKKIREGKIPTDEASVRALFSAFGLEQLEPADYGQPELTLPTPDAHPTIRASSSTPKIDWGEKPDTTLFFGRTSELATLNQWVQGDQCRLITLLGMGGIGKTSLAAKLANQIYDRFDYVIWRSLREAPPPDEILVRLIQFLSDQQETEINLPTRLGERIIRLLHYLREHRCLVVLDNLESILQAETAGYYRDGYEGYGELIQRIGSTEHQSCLLLTSRECPRELAPLAGDLTPVRLWSVGSIDTEAGREILKTKGLALDEADDQGQELIRRCSGNPQALHLVATAIQREFLGDVDDFLQEQVTAVEDVRSLLDQHLSRLALLERSVLFWLAINREPVGLDELMEDLLPPVTKQEVRRALRGLSDRYLIETVGKQFTLQNVIMEFATDRLAEQAGNELETQQFDIFHNHALIKATAKTYVRETQVRLILRPLSYCINNIAQKIRISLETTRQNHKWTRGYAAGNLLNLACQLQVDGGNLDFSALTLRQAYLRGMTLHNFNLEKSLFTQTLLTETFARIETVKFCSKDELLAFGDRQGSVRIWHVKTWQNLKSLMDQYDLDEAVALSPDGQYIASGDKNFKIQIRHVQTQDLLCILEGHTAQIRRIFFSPDGQYLASFSRDSTIRLWDTNKEESSIISPEDIDISEAVAFSPDGKYLAIGSRDFAIRLWDIRRKESSHVFAGHTCPVTAVVFNPNGQTLASTSCDNTIRLWDIQTQRCLCVFTENTHPAYPVAFSFDGRFLASGGTDSKIRLWDLQMQKLIHVFAGHNHRILSISFSPDNQILASSSDDSTIRIWNIQKRQCVHLLVGISHWIWSINFSPNGQFLAVGGSDDVELRVWSIHHKHWLPLLQGHSKGIGSVAFSPNSRFLASGSSDSTIRLWDICRTDSYILEGHAHWVRSVAFSPNGQLLASGSTDKTIRLWDVKNRKCLSVLTDTHGVLSIAFSPDGNFLASCSGGREDFSIRLWDIQRQRCCCVLTGHTSISTLAFSPDGQFIASSGSDSVIWIWDIQSQNCCSRLIGHDLSIYSVSFSPDGKFLASCSADATIRVWNVSQNQCLHVLRGHVGTLRSVVFSPSGETIASGGNDGKIRFWDVLTGKCLDTLQVPRPYEGTNITNVKGLTEAERTSMLILGAVDGSPEDIMNN